MTDLLPALALVVYLLAGIEPVVERSFEWHFCGRHFLPWVVAMTAALVAWPIFLAGHWLIGRRR